MIRLHNIGIVFSCNLQLISCSIPLIALLLLLLLLLLMLLVLFMLCYTVITVNKDLSIRGWSRVAVVSFAVSCGQLDVIERLASSDEVYSSGQRRRRRQLTLVGARAQVPGNCSSATLSCRNRDRPTQFNQYQSLAD